MVLSKSERELILRIIEANPPKYRIVMRPMSQFEIDWDSIPQDSPLRHGFIGQLPVSNYPTKEQLQTIRTWDYQDLDGLMEFVRPIFEVYGSIRWNGQDYILATGGWSGNEEIIDAILDNSMVKIAYYYSWARGGQYTFRKPNP